jgi:hypothetical protein
MSIIETFAEAHRLHTKLDGCGERIISGKQGQIHEYSDSELGVMFMMRRLIKSYGAAGIRNFGATSGGRQSPLG